MGITIDTVSHTLKVGATDNGHLRAHLCIHPNAIQTRSVVHFVDRVRFAARPWQIIMALGISDLTSDQRKVYRQRGLNWR